MTRQVLPLHSYRMLHTDNIDLARASIADSLAPHRLTPMGRTTEFQVLHNAADVGALSVHFIDYGSEVEVDVDEMDFQLVQIPLGGVTTISSGRDQFVATQRTAAVTPVGEPVKMRYSAGNPRLMVRVDASLMRERIALAESVGEPSFGKRASYFDVTHGAGRSWRSLVDVLVADLDREGGLSTAPLACRSLGLALVDGLIASTAPRSAEVAAGSASVRTIKRAAQLIEDHCSEPLASADIAEAVGVSVRSLRAGFQEHYATTPMAYLRLARLRHVRDDLLSGAVDSVTDAALRWGIGHLGRLAGDYRQAFGETPSETLRRA